MFPETVIVRLGFTVQVCAELEAKARLLVTELLPVALKKVLPAMVMELELISKAPVSVVTRFDGPPQFVVGLLPVIVRLPVPALAVNVEKPHHCPLRLIEALKVIAPFVGLVLRVRFPPWLLAVFRPKSPVIVIFPAVIVVSATS
jgi:hypothetical protein